MDIWISVGLAGASFLFGLWSWWASNKSRAARRAAESAENNARRATDAAEASATELRKLVESLSLPPLVATRPASANSRLVMLRNTTSELILVAEVLNADKFVRMTPEAELPFTIPPGAQFEILVMGAMGAQTPSNFHFSISQGGEVRDVHVPIPSRSS
ncbi:hypothetical protein ACT3UD_17010 [Glutamicibacter sp. 287]|uniref:hypothetical protein n=1 Tax=unclassified Glutamicibacter TaxID=2627139 RepID=UPI0040334885